MLRGKQIGLFILHRGTGREYTEVGKCSCFLAVMEWVNYMENNRPYLNGNILRKNLRHGRSHHQQAKMKSFEVCMTSRLGISSGLNGVVFLVDLGLRGGKKKK